MDMRSFRSQQGYALILAISVIAVIAVLSGVLAVALFNGKGATYHTTARSKALNVAEAGLDMAMFSLSSAWPSSPPAAGTTIPFDLRSMFPASDFPTSSGESFATVTMSPGSDLSHLWLQSQANVAGRSVRLRTEITQQSLSASGLMGGVALYSGGDTTFGGKAKIYSPGGAPPTGNVYVYGTTQVTGNANLATVGLYSLGPINVSGNNASFSSVKYGPYEGVPTFNDVLSPSQVGAWTSLAQSTTAAGTPVAGGANTIPHAGSAVYVGGSATLNSGTYNIGSLYVNGDLSVSGGVTLNIASLYVKGNFTISGGSVTITNLGSTWVGGDASLTGQGQVQLPLLVAAGNITLTAQGQWGGDGVGSNSKPCIVLSIGENATATLAGQGQFCGIFAATHLVLSGKADIYGSALSEGPASLTGQGSITYSPYVYSSIQGGSVSIATRVSGTWSQIVTQ
jgi:Tfp pilus assembly protein PilX